MGKVAILLTCLLAGFLLRQFSVVSQKHATLLNKTIIYFFIPLITINNIPELSLSVNLAWLSISPFLVFIMGWIYFRVLGRINNFDEESIRALILTGGISSTSFVGFPIFELLFGEIGLSYGVLMSLGGTILVFNTLGIGLLFHYTESQFSIAATLKRILTFIPFVVFVFALLMNLTSYQLPIIVKEIFRLLAAPFSAVALLTIGMQVELTSFKSLRSELIHGQVYKLVVAPLLIFVLGSFFYNLDSVIYKVSILGAAIGSMNAMSVMTMEKNIKPRLAVLMPAIGIPLSIITLFLIAFLINK